MSGKTIIATLVGETFVPAQVISDVSFVANALGGTTTTTSFSITLPATQAGDIIILEFAHRGTGNGTIGGTYNGPAFALKHSQLFATSTFSGKTYWSRATEDHAGQTVTGSGLTNSCAAIVTIYRGAAASGDPLSDATVVGEQNASANETQAEITTATDKAWVVLVVVNSPDLAVASQACTSPGALTGRAQSLSTGGTDSSIAHASEAKASAGATGALTWSQTDAASGSWAYAIKPNVTTPFADARAALRDGLDSAQSEATGWDAKVKPNIPLENIVRTSDTVCTVTLQAQADYDINAQETITWTLPGSALTGGTPIVAAPSFTIATAGQTVAVGQAVETELAQPIAWAPKHRLVAQATETDLAQAVARRKTKAVAQATETDVAQALTSRKTKALGQVSETDLAQAIAWAPKRRLIVQAIETDLAQAVTSRKTKAVVQATETDLAQGLTSSKTKAIAQSTETGLAQAVARVKSKTLGQPSETDTAQAIASRKTKALGQASETDLAQAITEGGATTVSVEQALETDLAQAITWAPKIRAIGQVSETDFAQAVAHLKTRSVDLALEIDLAQGIARTKLKALGQVSETDLAQALTRRKTKVLGQPGETDLAQSLAHLKTRTVDLVLEIDLAQGIGRSKARLIGLVSESDLAEPLSHFKSLQLGMALETDLAQIITPFGPPIFPPDAPLTRTRFGTPRIREITKSRTRMRYGIPRTREDAE